MQRGDHLFYSKTGRLVHLFLVMVHRHRGERNQAL